tara:strand:- start:453 stop:665 length:213 start_codon:yes stop_codon:yes gene_type:complete
MGNQWYNINKWVRVLVSTDDINFINKHRRNKKLSKSTLDLEEQKIIDILVKKAIFGRYKQGEETYYLFNK